MTKLSVLICALVSTRLASAQPAPPPPTPPTPPGEPVPPAPPPEPAPTEPTPATTATSPIVETPVATEEGSEVTVDPDHDDDEPDKKKHEVEYKAGKGFYLHHKGASLRLRTIVQPVIRFANIDCGPTVTPCPDPQSNMTIRRGRLGAKAKLPNHLGLDVEIQVKNLHLGITHFYGLWEPNPHLQIQVGFIKPPGNIERSVNIWETPWIERGVVSAWISIARVMGIMATGTSSDKTIFWKAAISKAVARGLDGAESEDQPPPRMGALDPDDIIKGAGQVNFDGRLEWDPNKNFEIGIAGGTRIRYDGDSGDNAPEPYDTPVAIAHQYKGVMLHGAIDMVVRQPHWRVIGEFGARRDGATAEINDDLTKPTGHLVGYVGEIMGSYTPDGKYASAHNFAYLKKGWELLARINAARIAQPDNEQAGFGGVARYVGFEIGAAAQLHKQLRLQFDATYQWFGDHAYGTNAGAKRIWAELWATWRL